MKQIPILLMLFLATGCTRAGDWTGFASATPPAEPTPPEVLALIEALGDDSRREEAIEGLVAIGEHAVPAVIGIINDHDARSSGYALRILTKIGKPAVPHLARSLDDPQLSVRYISVRALSGLNEDAADAVPALIKALDKKSDISRNAAVVLGDIGPAAVEPLVRVLDGDAEDMRALAAEGLLMTQIDVQAIPFWTELLNDRNPDVRGHAALALRLMSPSEEAKAVIPDLTRALEDEHYEVRMYAARALGDLGPESKVAVPALSRLLKDRHSSVRAHATSALGDLGPAAKAAVPALLDALKTGDRSFKESVTQALRRIDPTAAKAVVN